MAHRSYARSAAQADANLAIPSEWLKTNNADLIEIVHSGEQPIIPPPNLASSDASGMWVAESGPLDGSLSVAYTADILVLVLSELKSVSKPQLSRLILDLATKPDTLLALSTASPFPALAATRAFRAQLDSLVDPAAQPPIAPVQIEQALEALASLAPLDVPEGQMPAPVSFELFEVGYLTSGVPQLRERVAEAIQAAGAGSEGGEVGGASRLQVQTAGYVLDKLISVAANAAGQIKAGLAEAEAEVAQLAYEAAHAEAEANKELGVQDGKLAVPDDDIKRSMGAFNAMLLDRLKWWQLPSRVDDITLEVADEASRSFLVNLEDSLIFRTGRLLAIADKLDGATQALLDSGAFRPPAQAGLHPLASLHSPVLANEIARAALPTSPAALSQTLVARRTQISAPGGPAELLHARAQKSLASAATFSLGSAAASAWAVVAGLAELPTGVGCGLLGVTFGAWGLQRGWEKAKRKFNTDVGKRVKGGLEVDLGETAGVLVERVGWQARVAVEGSGEAVRRRRNELNAFRAKLSDLDARRRKI